ncbi:MAG: PrsW family glutamic-type intramembrane protease [Thermoflexales bacterium]|nr:PrsW family glutamic-type intramembrane protease [Thermoflexales bacterium]
MNVARDRKGLWRAGIVELLGLLAFVGIVELIASQLRPALAPELTLTLGIVLAIVPAALWLGFFHAQDRLEPEPRHFVFGVAVLGGLLALAVGQPLIEDFFRAPDWIGRDPLTQILGSILVVGFTQEFLKYAAVRYSVYFSGEFDERVDGVLYGTAAGLGYATVLNVRLITDSGSIAPEALGTAALVIAETALVQAALGGLTGYFIARAKFDNEPIWWMPAGLTLAAVINGLFAWLSDVVTSTSLVLSTEGAGRAEYAGWPALVLATVVAALLLAATFLLMRRANQLTLAGADADNR